MLQLGDSALDRYHSRVLDFFFSKQNCCVLISSLETFKAGRACSVSGLHPVPRPRLLLSLCNYCQFPEKQRLGNKNWNIFGLFSSSGHYNHSWILRLWDSRCNLLTKTGSKMFATVKQSNCRQDRWNWERLMSSSLLFCLYLFVSFAVHTQTQIKTTHATLTYLYPKLISVPSDRNST